MSDLPDFLSDEPPSAPAEAAPAAPPETPAAPAPSEAAPAAAEEPPKPVDPPPAAAASPEAAADPPVVHHVPLATHLDLREKLRETERRANELEQWRRQQEAAKTAPPIPDAYADPEAFQAYQQQQVSAQLYDQNLRFSERMATVTHGPDVVRAAKAWYDAEGGRDPFLDQKVRASPDPYETVVGEWKQRQLLSRIKPEDLDAFQQWQASQAGAAAPVAPNVPAGQQPPVRPQAPRASLAAAPSASATGAPVPPDGAQAFEGMFGPK